MFGVSATMRRVLTIVVRYFRTHVVRRKEMKLKRSDAVQSIVNVARPRMKFACSFVKPTCESPGLSREACRRDCGAPINRFT